ncbi:hypothetical protein Q5P01_000650 [Channa striata]|uniref:Uncharacterized protein n=1 Tax=Channa striata TaxID=64152 RepID=A0AA88IYX8_CHASR|nr:hypothetical protein Q5P01_000650 [Channa striata]
MQSDLQKELNVVFDENTKLTTLLHGKVPKNLVDNVELERKVANLNKELSASREAEEALRNQLEELASFQNLPEKVDNLIKQVCELKQELGAVQTQRDNLVTPTLNVRRRLSSSEPPCRCPRMRLWQSKQTSALVLL